MHAARKQDRRLQAALLAAAVAHTPEAEEVLRGARTRLARKPSALSRELLRNFPKGKGRRSRRRRKKAAAEAAAAAAAQAANGAPTTVESGPDEQVLAEALTSGPDGATPEEGPLDAESRDELDERVAEALDDEAPAVDGPEEEAEEPPKPKRTRRRKPAAKESEAEEAASADGDAPAEADGSESAPAEKPKPRRTRARKRPAADDAAGPSTPPAEEAA